MKALPIFIFLLVSLPLWSQAPPASELQISTLNDPRQVGAFYTLFEDGKEPKTEIAINHSILIICWMAAPDGSFGKYQIGGLDGYHTKQQVERFLARFYEMDHLKETKTAPPNIILAGNNWGVGLELKDTLRDISAKKSLSVYYIGGWAFSKVSLIPEPDLRKELIIRAFKEANP